MRPFRWLLACVMGLSLTGCPGSLIPSTESSKSADESSAPAGGEGAAANVEVAEGDAAPAEGGEAAPMEQPRQNAFQRVAELVDRNKYLEENPNAIETDGNRIEAGGYLQAVSQGYFSAASRLTIINFEHDLKLQKELNNGNWPTFENYKKILQTHGIELKGLRKNQVYAYNDQNGQVTVIELPEAAEAP